ncbi:hypothetical protein F4818DRAFT_396058 [Hypoxylon cercidicola]|nr:hypothetical protein F4818DRAFT_396058 [Hypoxylon cercidicola]
MHTKTVNTLSPAEAELLNTVLRNSAAGLKGMVDWNGVTEDSGYKSRKVTLTLFGQLCKKYNWLQGNNGTREPQEPQDTEKAPVNNSKDVSKASPKKSPKTSPKKRKRNVKEEQEF